MPRAKVTMSFPAQLAEGMDDHVPQVGDPVIVEIMDNGCAYVRPVAIDDMPGHNTLSVAQPTPPPAPPQEADHA